MSDDLAARRRALELEQLALAEEECTAKRAKLEGERNASQRIVRLNVGGVHFDTSRETLLFESGTLFHRLLEEPGLSTSFPVVGAQRDADGRIFIDRDPELFRLLLQGMRGSLNVPMLSAAQRETLLAEAQYFQLGRLETRLADGYDPYALSAADTDLRLQAQQLRERLGSSEETVARNAAEEADGVLIDVFAHAAEFTYTGARTSQLEYLFDRPLLHPPPKVGTPLEVTNAKDFRKRLDLFAGPLFAGLDMTDLVVAGGAVLQALNMGPEWNTAEVATEGHSDIDLFIVCDTDAAARLVYTRKPRMVDHRHAPLLSPHTLCSPRGRLVATTP